MDWAKAIAINHAALTRIVAGLVAMLELWTDKVPARLPQALYLAAERVLRPAESALRRLIVIAARGIKVKLQPRRSMPKGLVIVGTGSRTPSFSLLDTRKRFDEDGHDKPYIAGGPRVRSIGSFLRAHAPAPELEASLNAARLFRRLAAVKHALETLPRQAKRLARWKARRETMEQPKFRSPLRPGPPPGHREKPKEEIDFVLKECHGLAWDALMEDSS